MRKYPVRWKSEVLGEFSADEMRTMLSAGRFGFFHMVEAEAGRWVFMRDFLVSQSPYAASQDEANQVDSDEGERRLGQSEQVGAVRSDGVGTPSVYDARSYENGVSAENRRQALYWKMVGYILAGLSFLPWFFVVSLFFLMFFSKKVGSDEALKIGGLSVTFFLVGYVFFYVVFPEIY